MMKIFNLLLLFLACNAIYSNAQEAIEKKNLKEDWKIYNDQEFVPFSSSDEVQTIYFTIDPAYFRGDFLILNSTKPFDVFINGKLVNTNNTIKVYSIDSLGVAHSKLNFALRQEDGIIDLSTRLISYVQASEKISNFELENRPTSFYRDFIITALLLLFVYFTLLMRLNPGLTFDYFSIAKVFSLRESDDQTYTRILSTSILYYVFISLILALFFLILVFVAPTDFNLTGRLSANNYITALLNWLWISALIVGVIFIKWLLIYSFSYLFGFHDEASFHFFNFIRVLLILGIFITGVSVTYYVLRGESQNTYLFLFKTVSYALYIWIAVMFLKLGNRLSTSRFHLFSYLCATEILPLLIIAKVLYE